MRGVIPGVYKVALYNQLSFALGMEWMSVNLVGCFSSG